MDFASWYKMYVLLFSSHNFNFKYTKAFNVEEYYCIILLINNLLLFITSTSYFNMMGQIVHQILSIKYDIKVPSQICKRMNVDRHI